MERSSASYGRQRGIGATQLPYPCQQGHSKLSFKTDLGIKESSPNAGSSLGDSMSANQVPNVGLKRPVMCSPFSKGETHLKEQIQDRKPKVMYPLWNPTLVVINNLTHLTPKNKFLGGWTPIIRIRVVGMTNYL